MRKRAQRKSISVENDTKSPAVQTNFFKSFRLSKSLWIPLSLIAIFFLVLFLNSYFNIASGATFNSDSTGFGQYYLSGPDPYYNMRIVDQTLYGENPGYYPFYSENDPLLNYPLGRSGGRAPLLNMLAIGFGTLLTPFMEEIDAIGIAMQFIPALFGALLVFPVYFIGKTLFGKKEGLLGALLIALIPIHLGSGHGSAFALFDHDSLNLLLFFLTYYFLIKMIKETDTIRSILYALLAGMPLAALSMVWTEYEFLYAVIALYAIIQMLIDIFTSKIEMRIPRSLVITLFTGYLISLPVLISRAIRPDLPLYLCLGVAAFAIIYYFLNLKKIPWTLSLPSIFLIGAGALGFLYFVPSLAESFPMISPLNKISSILYGAGIYGNKVSETIAEAGLFGISRTVMSFGPALFWLAWIGFIFIGYYYLRNVARRDYFFLILLFIIQIWFLGVAGRFINDLVPLIALFSAWLIVYLVKRFDYVQMIRNIQSAGGGLRGLRRGVNFLHIFGVLFIAFIIILPNAYLSMDAAVPAIDKQEVFGDLPNGAFGSSFGKESYWIHAYDWFSQQDNEIENMVDRPAYISWWDYGFYEVAIGGHPTVADNFQDGIPPAANFHTSTSEIEAVSVWIIRLLEGNKQNTGFLDANVVDTLEMYLNISDAKNLTTWVEQPTLSPSYGAPIGEEYNPELSDDHPVGEQWPENAVYHDGVQLLSALSDENLTMLYHDIQEETGTSIRYYGVEGYDSSIFNIFGFLSDKSLLLIAGREGGNPEDDYYQIFYKTQQNNLIAFDEVDDRTNLENQEDPIVDTEESIKPLYYDTMFYRTYVGVVDNQTGTLTEPDFQLPCTDMRHFYAQYVSPYPEFAYSQGKSAVVIAKYYEGAIVNGTVTFQNESKEFEVVVQQNISHYGTQVPIDHDSAISVNGSYQVLVPAGVVTLQVRRYPELQVNALTLKNVTFNATDLSSNLAPITEKEATRKTAYYRTVNITIDSGNLSGYVYDNIDNDSLFNASVDMPIADVTVSIYGINSLDSATGQPTEYDFNMFKSVTTDEEGYYETTDLLPGYYQIVVTDKDGFQTINTLFPVNPGDNEYDILQPKPGNVSGTIYFDSDEDGAYTDGEEMDDVKVDLIYTTTGEETFVDSLVTDSSGRYEFTDLVIGTYRLNVSKLPEYETTSDITISEDETTVVNVSLQYAKITVAGITKRQDTLEPVDNISIVFRPDESITTNTAQQDSTMSNTNGEYIISLMPGIYNVTVNKMVNESGINVTYSYKKAQSFAIGQQTATYDILLTREEEQ